MSTLSERTNRSASPGPSAATTAAATPSAKSVLAISRSRRAP